MKNFKQTKQFLFRIFLAGIFLILYAVTASAVPVSAQGGISDDQRKASASLIKLDAYQGLDEAELSSGVWQFCGRAEHGALTGETYYDGALYVETLGDRSGGFVFEGARTAGLAHHPDGPLKPLCGLYGGKERMRDGGLNDYDFSARRLNSALALWTAPDPMARDFSNINPYVYCAANPIRYIDPTGCVLNICGNDSLSFINGIQNMLSSISISIGTNGSVSYSKIGNKKANKYDQKLMEIIDSNKVIVNIKAQKEDNISDNEYMVGGAFMGNSYNSELDNVTALQVVNPAFLNSLSKANNKKAGYDMFHELDEAFQGGLISLASKSSSPQAGIEGSVYLEAHNNAMPQSSMVYIFDFAPGINIIGLNNTELGIPIIVDDDKNRHMKPMRWKTIWRTERGKEIKRKIWDRRGF